MRARMEKWLQSQKEWLVRHRRQSQTVSWLGS
jgi:hypothetical protein